MQLRLAFHEARSESDKIVGSNLGIKEQEIVIARLREQVNAKRLGVLAIYNAYESREFLEQLRQANARSRNGNMGEIMEIDEEK